MKKKHNRKIEQIQSYDNSNLLKNEKYIVIFIISLAGILYLLSLNNYFWLDGDNVVYALLSKSILKGEYNNFHLITSPSNIFYWPGFPLLLTIPTFLFGDNVAMLKLIPIICTLIGLLFFYKYIKLKWGSKCALYSLLLLAINPVFFTFAHTILTQAPFFMSIIIALYYIEKSIIEDKSIKSKEFIIGILFTVFSKYVRPEGDFFALFIAIYLILQKKYKHLAILSVSYILLTGLWNIKIRMMYNNATSFQKEYFLPLTGRLQNILRKSLTSDKMEFLSIKEIINRIIDGWKIYFTYIIPDITFGIKFIAGKIFWGIVIFVFITIGWFETLKIKSIKEILKKLSPIHLYFMFGFTLVILALGRSEKYLYPIIPFILFFIFRAIYYILRNLHKSLFFLIFIIFSIFSISQTFSNLAKERGRPYYDPYFDNYIELAKWCKKNTPHNSKFITRKSEYFYWYSKCQGANILYKEPLENLIYINKLDADFITVSYMGFDGISNPYLFQLLRTYPQFFSVYYSSHVPGISNQVVYYVLKVKKDALKKFITKGKTNE